jgi:dTDP-glucose 4,6-dehydratase
VLDKLTYSGNRAGPGASARFHGGDIVDPGRSPGAARGYDAIVNFAAETHVDRSILDATAFGRTEFFGTQVLLEHVRQSGARFVRSRPTGSTAISSWAAGARIDPRGRPAPTA